MVCIIILHQPYFKLCLELILLIQLNFIYQSTISTKKIMLRQHSETDTTSIGVGLVQEPVEMNPRFTDANMKLICDSLRRIS
ncbi:hypothetical protein X975_05739, partial [Stegodyphus mimosarum]